MITFLKKKIVEQRETFQFISSLASVFPLMKSFEKKKNQIRERKNYRQLKGIFFKEFFLKNFFEHSSTSKKKYKKVKKNLRKKTDTSSQKS